MPRIVAGIVCAFIFLAGFGCDSDRETERTSRGQREMRPDQEIEQFVLEETVKGQVQWILRAKWAAVYDKEQLVRVTGVALDFLDSAGDVTSTLHSDRGLLERETHDMQAEGHVSIVTRDSVVLKTQHLAYSSEDNKVRTEGFVEITRGGDVITGYGLESDPELKQFELKREIKGKIKGDSKGF